MFLCEVTKKMSRHGEECCKVVVERRERVYTRHVIDRENNTEFDEEIGRGWEIVKEVDATEDGAKLYSILGRMPTQAEVSDYFHGKFGA
jgi:hypothetical protein